MSSSARWASDVLVVVRGIRERTEDAVTALAREIVGPANVVAVTGAPFSETLRKSFAVAAQRDRPWTYCVDADVLFTSEALVYFRQAVRVAPRRLFGIQGLVLDKFFGGIRPAGARVYRTALLKRALAHIPQGERSKRPETFARRAMQQEGYEWFSHGILTGLHDFEQYYRDIYRTAFFHAQKHGKYIPVLRPYWERMSQQDADFLVALRGAADGAREEKILGLDARNFPERAAQVLVELGLKEKQPFQTSADELTGFVEDTISHWKVPPEYDAFYQQTQELSRAARWLGRSVLRRLGLSGVPEQ